MRPDADLAEAEGLAAGTGLLTGTVARTSTKAVIAPCPNCGGTAEVVVVDLILASTTMRCRSCRRRWTIADATQATSQRLTAQP